MTRVARVALVAGLALLLVFVVWTSLTARAELVTYHSKYSIFARHYRHYGFAKTKLLPFYNFELTDPPSTPYVSHPPLVPLIMYGASRVFGDQPSTYHGVILGLHVVAFILLASFAYRRWGPEAGWWTLVLAVLNRYATTYGDQQTPELLGVIGSFTAVFLYFEWLETRRRRLMLLAVAAYAVGLASDYCTALTGLAIGVHWLFSTARTRTRQDGRTVMLLPAVTLVVAGVMAASMWAAGVPLASPLQRAAARSSTNVDAGALRTIVGSTADLLGPVIAIAALAFVVFHVFARRRDERSADGRTLQLLACLAAPGLLFVALFGQAYVAHRFLVMYLVPFFIVAAALGITRATSVWSPAGARPLVSVALVAVAAWAAFHGNARIGTSRDVGGPTTDDDGRYRRLAQLASAVRPHLREGDRLLILDGERYSSLSKVTAFYELWIPTLDGGQPDTWDNALATGMYRLVLTTDAEALTWMRSRAGARLLASEAPLGFFETSAASEEPPPADASRAR